LANALFEFFSRKLPVSRLQRDLTDSTVLRNIGVAFGHTVVALHNISEGLLTVTPNVDRIVADLNQHWEVVTEGIQTVLRATGDHDAYDKLKRFTREQAGVVTEEGVLNFVRELDVQDETLRQRLASVTPITYGPMLPKTKKNE
jgi:adenylosuccinate lyase